MAADAIVQDSADSLDLVFHGAAYNLSITVSSSRAGGAPEASLALDLEELGSGAAWHAEFTASYIEMLTSKTGSSKRFDVLVKMLRGALFRHSDAVFLDLLPYADLARRRGAPPSADRPPPPPSPCKPRGVTHSN